MTHDLLIKDGTVIDGTGAPPVRADVAVDGDKISEIGDISADAVKTISAEDKIVTPGFVDLHTHFDAQAGWDPYLTPVSWHGVTTALFGNCGVTFAPCKPQDQDFLAGMMETVEDIPKNAILTGLPWDWVSYGEYLNSVEALDPAINITGLVGHCASRFYVMGERSITDDATDDEIEQIAKLVGQSVKEGAIGFSTNRLPGHTLPDGRSIPGTFAQPKELVEISKQVAKHGGILQSVLNYGKLDEELGILRDQMRASGARLLFSAPYHPSSKGEISGYESHIADMHAEGLDISGLTLPRSGGFLGGLRTRMPYQGTSAAWNQLQAMSFEDRVAAIQDSEFRSTLVEEAKAFKHSEMYTQHLRSWFWLGEGEQPQYAQDESASLAEQAHAQGKHPSELFLDKMLETDGLGFSTFVSSIKISKHSSLFCRRIGYCRGSAMQVHMSVRSWTPAGPPSCSRIGSGTRGCSGSRKRFED